MIQTLRHPWLRKTAALLGLWVLFISFLPMALADAKEDAKENAKQELAGRQRDVSDSYDQADSRVTDMDPTDPRKTIKDINGDDISKLLDNAKKAKNDFTSLKPEDFVNSDGSYIDAPNEDGNLKCDKSKIECFSLFEKNAIEKITIVNRFMINPVQPGAKKAGETGSVPKGDLTRDFIPNLIRLLFRFTSVVILISFVVSGAMFIIAYDNEEFVTKAKHMLYYSLMGFAFVTLAYAIVKGITQVNYFGVV
jgi:hypothetical protein